MTGLQNYHFIASYSDRITVNNKEGKKNIDKNKKKEDKIPLDWNFQWEYKERNALWNSLHGKTSSLSII